MSRVEIKQAMIAKEVLNGDWWANLPAMVRRDVEESLAQADRGEAVSHAEAMKQVEAFLVR